MMSDQEIIDDIMYGMKVSGQLQELIDLCKDDPKDDHYILTQSYNTFPEYVILQDGTLKHDSPKNYVYSPTLAKMFEISFEKIKEFHNFKEEIKKRMNPPIPETIIKDGERISQSRIYRHCWWVSKGEEFMEKEIRAAYRIENEDDYRQYLKKVKSDCKKILTRIKK